MRPFRARIPWTGPTPAATALAAAAALLVPVVSDAAARTWTGAGADDNLSTPANWSPSGTPAAGDAITFAGSTRLTPVNDLPPLSASDPGLDVGFADGAGAFTVGGAPLTVRSVTDANAAAGASLNLPLALRPAADGSVNFGVTAAAGRLTVAAPITDDGATPAGLTKVGPGTLVLTGNNTYTGGTNVFEGVLEVPSISNSGSPGPLGATTDPSQPIRITAGTLRYTGGGGTTDRRVILGPVSSPTPNAAIEVTSPTADLNLSGNVNNYGVATPLKKLGPGTLTLSGTTDNNSVMLDVVGGTLVLAKTSGPAVHAIGMAAGEELPVRTGATLRIGGTGGDQILDGVTVVLEPGATFDLNGRSEAIGALRGTGIVTSSSGSGLRTLSIASTKFQVFGGVIEDGPSGTTGLTVGGAVPALFKLSGPNTYSGPTQVVSGGGLSVEPGGRLGAPDGTAEVSISGGGSLYLHSAAISDLATLRITDDQFAKEVQLDAGVADAIASLVLNNKTFGPGVYGSTASGATNNSAIVAAGLKPDNFFGGTGVIVVVPEPAAAGLIGLAALAASAKRRRR